MGKSKDLASGNSAAYVETAGDTITGDTVVATTTQVPLRIENTAANSLGSYLKIRDGNSTASQHTWIGRSTNDTYIYSNNSDLGMKITNAGQVTKPNNPWLSVQAGSGGWISFASGENQLTSLFTSSTVYQNTGGGFNKSNATYTAPVAGRYCFMWNTYTRGGSNSAATTYVYPRLYKNGVAMHPRSNILHYTTGTGYDTGTENTILADLAVNDTIVAGCYSNNTTNQYYAASMHLQMFFVG